MRAAGIDAPPVWLDETGSTNDVARELAEDGALEWTVVATAHQTAGRGRLGRSWTDAPGKTLMFSVVLRPRLRPEDAPLVGLAAAVDMLASVGHPNLRSKWPNDLVLGERKVGGILAEANVSGSRLEHVVLGIGLNVSMAAADFPAELRRVATSLAAEGIDADPGAILTGFLAGLRSRVPFRSAEIVAEYRRGCATIGRSVRARTIGGQLVDGTALDVDDRGSLLVDSSGSVHAIPFGEVEHLR